MQNFNATREIAALDGLIGAADGPLGPESLDLLAQIGGQVLAGIEPLENRIERGIILEVVEQPGVLHFKTGR